MPYKGDLDPQDLFAERHSQMTKRGLSAADVDAVRAAVAEMWPDRAGGWVHEWSRLGSRYAQAGRHDLAALAYGWAKFPVLADAAKRQAFARQIEEYGLAASGFPVEVVRRPFELPFAGARTEVPTYLLAAPGTPADAPVLIASGGIDTWKIDLHPLFAGLALATGARVLAFDLPGTGESVLPLGRAGLEVIDGLVTAARRIGDGRVVHLGISLGGYAAAYSGLRGIVDGAVVLGGPVERAFAPDREWRFGMADIFANAAGFDHRPAAGELAAMMAPLSLRPLFDQDANSPMLVINGAEDVHVPRHDTLVFEGRRDTRVELIPGTDHCAGSRLPEVIPTIVAWITELLARG